jgi:hypothetical protein
MVDLESGKVMDETMRLFDLYKIKHLREIERKHQLIKATVPSAFPWSFRALIVGCY